MRIDFGFAQGLHVLRQRGVLTAQFRLKIVITDRRLIRCLANRRPVDLKGILTLNSTAKVQAVITQNIQMAEREVKIELHCV